VNCAQNKLNGLIWVFFS